MECQPVLLQSSADRWIVAKSFLTETVSRMQKAGASEQLTVRADSAVYNKAVRQTAVKFNARFSVTVRQDQEIRVALEPMEDTSRQPIP